MKQLTLIGIGTGDPDHLTEAGRKALASVDCVLIPRKGAEKDDLAELRRVIVRTAAPELRVIEFDLPVRDTSLDYRDGVEQWHDAIAKAWRTAVPPEVAHVGMLIWGDPSLYDSTLRIAERLTPAPELRVIPGVTALQALMAGFAIPLNEINAPVLITTGRQLRDHGWPDGVDRLAVMLDGKCSFQTLDPVGVTIWWGAYLGLPNQLLRHGPLAEVGGDIVALRQAARAEHGWIMDTYILSRSRN